MSPRTRTKQDSEVNQAIEDLARHLLLHGLDDAFRDSAKRLSSSFSTKDLGELRSLFHRPPPEADVYSVEEHGLGGWLSACQFAIFEIIYNMGEEAIPFIREIAWGVYDWTQGNAIELLIRFAAEGIQTEALISEIREKYPEIAYEAQLYAIQPLVKKLEDDESLRRVFDELMEIEDFKDCYDELTYVDPDPYNVQKETLHGRVVVSSSSSSEGMPSARVAALLDLEDFRYGPFSKRGGRVRVRIEDDCKMFRVEGEDVLSATLDELLEAEVVAIGHWSFEITSTDPVSICPRTITKIR